ncbi:uncharacterized protein [Henckelia pumila]|uniref:uncharacterized protein n=1 Tax=Henckelia pumila TaxID=405737 RepID=UPI003C6E178F
MGQLATAINKLEAEHSNAFPSQKILNPRENTSAITLRNGKKLKVKEKEVDASPKEKLQEEPKANDREASKEEAPRGPVTSIREHIFFHGFSQNYVNWIWHGESAENDRVNWSTNQDPTDDYHKDFETTNMCEAAYENYTENPEELVNFLEDAEKPLYNGCKRYTKLSALVKLYNTKARHGMSDALFSDLLIDFGDMLPDNHNLPSSTYDAKKTLSCLSLSHEKIHACSNDCILYRKQYKYCVSCPKCGLSCWNLTKKNIEKKGVPAKVMWYFPPIRRFKRMYKSLETLKNLTWHKETTRVAGQLRHPSDSPSWRLVDHMWTDFESEPRNLRLALAADGINPHSNLSKKRKKEKENNVEGSTKEKDLGATDFRKCWKKKSIFFNLPYWKHLHVRHCLDVMHIKKNVFESLINTLMNVKGKTKDNVAARLYMLQIGVRPELRPEFGEKKTYLPPSACSFVGKR